MDKITCRGIERVTIKHESWIVTAQKCLPRCAGFDICKAGNLRRKANSKKTCRAIGWRLMLQTFTLRSRARLSLFGPKMVDGFAVFEYAQMQMRKIRKAAHANLTQYIASLDYIARFFAQ